MSSEQEPFEELMNASSLRASHVRAPGEPIPEEAQERLREATETLGVRVSEQLTKEKAQAAASAVGALILCKNVSSLEEQILREALAVTWTLYDRADEEESE
ncbi:hypothetical protein AB0D68_11000 [Streptomyces sp. NPDC048212]|uniref:hypothetical protein n=1 Tax=Streptomyces sp. NPDC048212 TaxID=3156658 RepID=UPI00340E111E